MNDKIDTVGAAFPIAYTESSFGNQNPLMPETGMTLRDYFAASAMQALINKTKNDAVSNHGTQCQDEIANDAFKIADAMLRQREINY